VPKPERQTARVALLINEMLARKTLKVQRAAAVVDDL
jgi:hypothetical protein